MCRSRVPLLLVRRCKGRSALTKSFLCESAFGRIQTNRNRLTDVYAENMFLTHVRCLGSPRSSQPVFSVEITDNSSWRTLCVFFCFVLYSCFCILFLWVCLWNVIIALNEEVHAAREKSWLCLDFSVKTQFNYPQKVYSLLSFWTSPSV